MERNSVEFYSALALKRNHSSSTGMNSLHNDSPWICIHLKSTNCGTE